MAAKKKRLPKEIKQLLEAGDIEELKKQLALCEPNAISGKYGSNIFSLTPLPRELAVWAQQQGADVNFKDYYEKTPIFLQVSAWNGDAQLLIDLGADVHVAQYDGTTPLHLASIYGRTQAVKALLAAGAEVDARTAGHADSLTPLEMTIRQQRLPLLPLYQVCVLLLDAGAEMTPRCRQWVVKELERFQRNRLCIKNLEFLAQQVEGMERLCQLFHVSPAPEPPVHDGVSPIVITEEGFAARFKKLWEYLIPPAGRARTAQGEAVRIAGRIDDELMRNGGANWDKDYREMLKKLPEYLRLGTPLPEQDLAEAERLARFLQSGRPDGEASQALCAYAVAWVMQNPEVIPPLEGNYKR